MRWNQLFAHKVRRASKYAAMSAYYGRILDDHVRGFVRGRRHWHHSSFDAESIWNDALLELIGSNPVSLVTTRSAGESHSHSAVRCEASLGRRSSTKRRCRKIDQAPLSEKALRAGRRPCISGFLRAAASLLGDIHFAPFVLGGEMD